MADCKSQALTCDHFRKVGRTVMPMLWYARDGATNFRTIDDVTGEITAVAKAADAHPEN